MARTNNLSNFLTDVAGAIKEKKGSEAAIPAANFDTEIRNLPSQGTYQHKTVPVTQNGTQTVIPDAGYDAIDELTINTAVPEKQLQTKTYNFTQNATLELTPDSGYDGFNQVNLNINVSGGSVNNQDKTITENGVYTADQGYTGIGTATVNVPQPQNMSVNIPQSITIDMFDDSTRLDVPLFVLPSNIQNITVAGIFYGRYNSEDPWMTGNVNGEIHIVEGALSKAVYMNLFSFWSNYGKMQIILVADGYNTIIQDIALTKVSHNYGLIHYVIQDNTYNNVVNSMQWTIIDQNTGDPVQPISMTHVSIDHQCEMLIALPSGSYVIDMTVEGISMATQYTWISNNASAYLYLSPEPLPGFTVNGSAYIITIDGAMLTAAAISGTITVYDDQDTLLHTETISLLPEGWINYTYVGEFDHYVISLTCWETGGTWSQTYSDSVYNESIEFLESSSYCSITYGFSVDYEASTTNAATLMSDTGMAFQEVDPVTEEFIQNASYIAFNNSSGGACAKVKWNSANNCKLLVTDSDYEPVDQLIPSGYSPFTVFSIFTKQPTITVEATLVDIDGNNLPFADYGNYSFAVVEENLHGQALPYEVVNDGNGNAKLVVETSARNGDVTCILGNDTFVKPELLIISYATVAQYDVDTTVSTTLQVPCTINSNYVCVAMNLGTVEGFLLTSIPDEVYDNVYETSTPLNTYEWTELDDVYELSKVKHVIKVPRGIDVTFGNTNHLVNYNNLDYYVPNVTLNIVGQHYNPFSYIPDPFVVYDTAMFPRVAVWQWSGGPQADWTYADMYKIEVYQNGILVNTNTNLTGVYNCPLSFSLNDVVEFRIYRNESTVGELPQWSQTYYTLQTTTITEVNKLYSLKVISLEEADAYIDNDLPYINKHGYRYTGQPYSGNTVEIVDVYDPIDLIEDGITVYNVDNEDITSYCNVSVEFRDINGTVVNPEDYKVTWHPSTGEFTYDGPTSLSLSQYNESSEYSFSVTDYYNGILTNATNYAIFVPACAPVIDSTYRLWLMQPYTATISGNTYTKVNIFGIANISGTAQPSNMVVLSILDNSNNELAELHGTINALPTGGSYQYNHAASFISNSGVSIDVNDIAGYAIKSVTPAS